MTTKTKVVCLLIAVVIGLTLVVVDVRSSSAKQPSERRLDEEALSRMDDEGGSNDPAVKPPDAARKAAPGS
jgi:hypothetical protein